ncbi:SDR family NAD(P)-dependent oxidoreductase [Rubrobacter tropicus]|uniref:SDR family NAD(P)-dependent oxidoreductase n=1 Tax=Rubrobacter tropicus TaxID=2653851 RepID=A0A6G8QDK4_9ACTN|nr:SDR family NAD(P)-dependent oxidoreductase [Rubrobacter tropicus]QIN84559.1 SDR family NAD(P)-dependent oxidoreductase [Rubrobacter tropicus]
MAVDDARRATEHPAMVGGGDLAGKTAVVLGATGHFGAATARMLGHEGANLVLGGRSRDRLEALEKEITDSGGRALVVGTHLAKRHHLDHLMEAAVEGFGGLDALLFMARASAPPLASLDVEAFERSVDVNVKGFLYAVTAALPIMRGGGGGCVVYFSAAPDAPDPLCDMGQAAARVLLRELGREFHEERIRASEVALSDPLRPDATGRCAEAVRRALIMPDGETAGFSDHTV